MSLNVNSVKKIVGIKVHGSACQHCDKGEVLKFTKPSEQLNIDNASN